MANYNTLAANVAAVVRQNGVQAITGDNLQAVILAVINSLGTGYQFKGIATPATVFGSPDERLFYLATQAGTYANLPVVTPPTLDGKKAWLFVYGSEWTALELDIPTASAMPSLEDYAKKDGSYPMLVAGLADGIKSRGPVAALFNGRSVVAGTGAGPANISKIKGRSIIWNQWYNKGHNISVPAGVTVEKYEDGSLQVTANLSAISLCVISVVPMVAGHKYLILGGSVNVKLYFYLSSIYDEGAGNFYTAPQTVNANLGIFCVAGTYTQKVHPQVFDLTDIFGEGNEPGTVAEFRELYSIDMYGLSAASIKHLTATGLVSKDGNGNTLTSLALPITTAEAGGVAIFPDGMKSVGSTCDEMTATTATKRIGSRAYQAGDESDTSVMTDGTTTLYVLETPEEYTLDTPLDLRYLVAPGGSEEKSPADTASSVTAPLSLDVVYPLEAADTGTVKNLLEALKTAGVISAYTMTYNASTGNYDFTITA